MELVEQYNSLAGPAYLTLYIRLPDKSSNKPEESGVTCELYFVPKLGLTKRPVKHGELMTLETAKNHVESLLDGMML